MSLEIQAQESDIWGIQMFKQRYRMTWTSFYQFLSDPIYEMPQRIVNIRGTKEGLEVDVDYTHPDNASQELSLYIVR